jgi:hypothetical protein
MSKALPRHAHHVAECAWLSHELLTVTGVTAQLILAALLISEIVIWLILRDE